MHRPFLILLIPLVLGILFANFFKVNILISLFLFFFSLIYLFYNIIKGEFKLRTLFILFFMLGIFISISNDSRVLKYELNKRVDCKGRVEQVLYKDDSRGKYIVSIKNINNKTIKKEKIILNIIGSMDIEIGDKISFNGELKLPQENTNPKLFNYKMHLKADKIYTTMSIKDYSITNIDKNNRTMRHDIKGKITNNIENLFKSHLNPKNSSLITSIILGKSSYLEEDNLTIYREMGLAHILAVSGLHIGLIAGFIFFVLSNIGIKRRANILLILTIIWTYGYLIDFPPSILRANIMFSILFYSQLIHQPYDSINTLSLAAFILLIINPYYLFNIGFQLSFAATFSMIILSPRIREWFYPYQNKLADTLASLFAVHIGLLPIQSYYFNSISLLSILANILIVPLLSLCLILAFLMIIFLYTVPIINIGLGYILNIGLSVQFKIIYILDSIPLNTIRLSSPEFITIVGFYIMIFIIFKIIRIDNLDKNIARTIIFISIFSAIWNLYILATDHSVKLHFIDVGQGDAILIRGKNNNYLMDTGGSFLPNMNIGKNITLPYLEKHGIKKLDGVFITHFHEDHYQGIGALLGNIKINKIISSDYPDDEEFVKGIKEHNIPFAVVKRGHRYSLDEDLDLNIIWPLDNIDSNLNTNNKSLVSILSTEEFDILLTGDIEKEGELLIAEAMSDNIDIIKVPHHGSDTSSTKELLESIRPDIGIISVGRNNMYGHPDSEIIERYNKFATKLYRTDYNGRVLLKLDKENYEIDTFLQEGHKTKPTFTEFINENSLIILYDIISLFLLYILIKTLYRSDLNAL